MLNTMKSRNTGKGLLFIIIALFNCCLVAQTLDPYNFFPSSVGNVWEYSNGLRTEILRDSIGQDSSKYLWCPNYTPPLYKVDTMFNVFWDPIGGMFGPGANWLYFMLDIDSGKTWIVDIHHIIDTFYVYKLAKVDSVFDGYFYDRFTTFKAITYYQYQPDSIINQYSWPENIITLAYGIGEVENITIEGGQPVVLLGCIIDGDTIGVITSAEDEQNIVNSFELFQNYPNPFNPTTTIKFVMGKSGNTIIKVYNSLGKEISTLINEYLSSGEKEISWDGKDNKGNTVSSGVYFIQMTAGNYRQTIKAVLLK